MGAAVFFLVFNFASGILYTVIKFDILGHSDGTGVLPGPWLVVPFLAVAVPPAALAVGLLVYGVRRLGGRTGGFTTLVAGAFVLCSVVFHVLVIRSIVLDPTEYAV